MIRVDMQEQFAEVPDVTVWADDSRLDVFYVLPQSPRFRLQNGIPVFKLIKYRLPIDRPDKKKGGGFVLFDTEVAVDADKLAKLKELLTARVRQKYQQAGLPGPFPEATFGTITYTHGTVQLLLEKDDVLIQKVTGAASHKMAPGDVFHIPAKAPHQMLVPKDLVIQVVKVDSK